MEAEYKTILVGGMMGYTAMVKELKGKDDEIESLKAALASMSKESQLMKDQFVDTRKYLQAVRQDAEEKKNEALKELAEAKRERNFYIARHDQRVNELGEELAEAKSRNERLEKFETSWATTTDVLNQELRENGPVDVGQYHRPEDTKNGIRYLVDVLRRGFGKRAEKAEQGLHIGLIERDGYNARLDAALKELAEAKDSIENLTVIGIETEKELAELKAKSTVKDVGHWTASGDFCDRSDCACTSKSTVKGED